MSRHLSNPYYWLFGFLMGLITGALVSTVLNQNFPFSGATLVAASGLRPTDSSLAAATSSKQMLSFNIGSDELLSGDGNYPSALNAWDHPTALVGYNIRFQEASGNVDAGRPANSQGKFKFTLHAATASSEGTSDNRFITDKTVSVVLVRVSDDAPMSSHAYSTSGDVLLKVLINATDPLNPFYETHFKRADLIEPNTGLAPSGPGIYALKVSVLGAEGHRMLLATSRPVTF
jgi:hypothetical protein